MQSPNSQVTIFDGENIYHIQTDARMPYLILHQAGHPLASTDEILYHGTLLPADFELPSGGAYTLQILRGVDLTLNTPEGSQVFHTNAATVGEALSQLGLIVNNADQISPTLETPITSNLAVNFKPAHLVNIRIDDYTTRIYSTKATVGEALSAAGMALTGLDRSVPGENEMLSENEQIEIIRSTETLIIKEEKIPYTKKIEYFADIPAGEQKVIQPGEPGLTISRVRTRFENDREISKLTETRSLVREPKQAIIGLSTKVQINSINTPLGPMQYWRSAQMYATSYSPCRSGTSKCSPNTASGVPVRQGVVAMIYSIFTQLAGTQVYVPGYGLAVISDVGGGFPDGRLWIDLGYSDADYQPWSGFVTVYFLAPAPAVIPAELR